MTTPVLARPARSNDDQDIQPHLSIPLIHARPAVSTGPYPNNDHNLVSGRQTHRQQTHRQHSKLELYARYSLHMFIFACMFVGVGTSALAMNGPNYQPAIRIPLMVATIASWFTLATLFLASLHMPLLKQLEWARMKRTLLFPAGSLVLSGLAFIAAFLASTSAGTECAAGSRMAGILMERVLLIVVVAGGSGLIYSMQRTLTENA